MGNPCIITVAITGPLPGKKDNPAVPISVEEQVESTHSPERFARVLEGICKQCRA
jgi:3-keto-5-aminohexanoate cleavage enzyme